MTAPLASHSSSIPPLKPWISLPRSSFFSALPQKKRADLARTMNGDEGIRIDAYREDRKARKAR
jgi:hypothetical protein